MGTTTTLGFEIDQRLTDPAVLPGFSIPTSAIFEGV